MNSDEQASKQNSPQNLQKDTRSEFLKTHWLAYPAMPNFPQYGRVQKIDGTQLSVNQASIDLSIFTQLGPVKEGRLKFRPQEILGPGDLICWNTETKEIWLLVPNKATTEIAAIKPQLQYDWRGFLRQVEDFFLARDFQFISTPSFVDCPGTEPYIDFFETEFMMEGRKSVKKYLPSSPELHLKKSLSLGFNKVFEMRTCFRNSEFTKSHLPEFWMLEWYRAFADLESIQKDTIELISNMANRAGQNPRIKISSMAKLFSEFMNIQLRPDTTYEQYFQWNRELGHQPKKEDSIDDLFFRLFISHIETRLDHETVLIVRDYPPFQAAYARLNSEGWADRFEVYWKGFELANAFHEVNDPDLQKSRMLSDLERRKVLGRVAVNLDENFFSHLRYGLPPSGGIALGLDRLFMAIHGLNQIQDLRIFDLQK